MARACFSESLTGVARLGLQLCSIVLGGPKPDRDFGPQEDEIDIEVLRSNGVPNRNVYALFVVLVRVLLTIHNPGLQVSSPLPGMQTIEGEVFSPIKK